jgi:hypothetical protein
MFERPLVLWLLAATPLMAMPGILAMRAGRRFAGMLSAALRMGAFASLILILAGARLPFRATARRMAVIVAMDQSESIASDQREWMRQKIAALSRAMDPRDSLAVIGFGRDGQLLAPLGDPRLLTLSGTSANPGATDIAGALTLAAGIFPPAAEKRVILLSDGVETADNASAGRRRHPRLYRRAAALDQRPYRVDQLRGAGDGPRANQFRAPSRYR